MHRIRKMNTNYFKVVTRKTVVQNDLFIDWSKVTSIMLIPKQKYVTVWSVCLEITLKGPYV